MCVVPLLLATAGGKGFDAKGTACKCTEFNGRWVPSEGVAQLVLPQHGMSLWWQHAMLMIIHAIPNRCSDCSSARQLVVVSGSQPGSGRDPWSSQNSTDQGRPHPCLQ